VRTDNPVLIVAAHPDDEVLGCGGTIARLAQSGRDVYIVILGEGMTSRYPQREHADESLVQRLHDCSKGVAAFLGARDVLMYGLPDNRFDTLPLLDIVKTLEGVIADLQPRVVYTQSGADLNIDHVITCRATLTATRPTVGCSVRDLYVYEVPSSTEWGFEQFAPAFRPNVFVDIDLTLEKKIQAMQLYDTEARPFPHPRSPEALRALAHWRGAQVGLRAAEAFELVRRIG
jgi:LmbE family N-acetylglucosaminyl deacetylase